MMRQKISVIVIILLLSFVQATLASAQSVFSLDYLGEHTFRGGARASGLGYSSLAVPDSNGVLSMNLAATADISMITFALFQRVSMSEAVYGSNESYQNRYQLPSALVAAPLVKGLVFSIGYRTRFQGVADFSIPGEIETPDYISVPTPLESYELDSSLYTVPIGLSWKAHDRIRLAGEIQIERGSIRDRVSVDFNNSDYGAAYSERKRTFSGTSWGLSFLLEAHRRLFLAGSVDGVVDYSVSEYIDNSREEFNSSDSWDFELPPSFAGGIYAGITDRLWFSSTYWTREAPGTRGFEQLEGALRDETLIAFGLERTRGGGEEGFFSRIPLRIGYYENVWHLENPAGESIKSRFFTMGSGLELPGGPGSLDYSFEFGKIGSNDTNGIEEKVLRFTLSISVSEEWKRRKVVKH